MLLNRIVRFYLTRSKITPILTTESLPSKRYSEKLCFKGEKKSWSFISFFLGMMLLKLLGSRAFSE